MQSERARARFCLSFATNPDLSCGKSGYRRPAQGPDARHNNSFLRRTSEQRIRHIRVGCHVEPVVLQAKSKAQQVSLSADHQSCCDELLLPNKWEPEVFPFLLRLYQLFPPKTPVIGIEIKLADPIILTRLSGNP